MTGLPDRQVKNLTTGLGTTAPPDRLPAAAKREWRRVVKACAAWPLWLQEADRPLLEAWCCWVAIEQEAIAELKAGGVLVAGRSSADAARDAKVKNVAVSVLRAASAELRALASRLAFDPHSRAAIPLGAFEPEDDDAEVARRLLS